jgi:hypothetical protein
MQEQKQQEQRVRESELKRANDVVEDLEPEQLESAAIKGGVQAVQKKWLPGNV